MTPAGTAYAAGDEATEPEQPLIPLLPDDVAVNCLARVPRSHHAALSLVSKSFRSLLSSTVFFNARCLLNSTQELLYLTIRPHKFSSPHIWFTLHQSLSGHFLVPVPAAPSLYIGSAYASVGPKIYVLGGSINDVPSPHVWVLDCRLNSWERAPNMGVGREFAAAGVVDGKIYVMGGCCGDSWSRSKNWAEVFDPAIGRWEAVPSQTDLRHKWMHASAVIDDKIYAMADRGGVVYDPSNGVWENVPKRLDLEWRGRACSVDGILYCYDFLGKIRGFDVSEGKWKELNGVGKALPKFLCGATMANVGGRLVVVWETKSSRKEMEIWCADIDVKKNAKGELWGKIAWCNSVLKVPNGSSIIHCLAVAL